MFSVHEEPAKCRAAAEGRRLVGGIEGESVLPPRKRISKGSIMIEGDETRRDRLSKVNEWNGNSVLANR